MKINTGTPYGGKKALLHVNRLWVWKKPMFGGWTALQRISSKNFAINARSIDTIGKLDSYLQCGRGESGPDSVKIMLLLKNPQFLLNHYKT